MTNFLFSIAELSKNQHADIFMKFFNHFVKFAYQFNLQDISRTYQALDIVKMTENPSIKVHHKELLERVRVVGMSI